MEDKHDFWLLQLQDRGKQICFLNILDQIYLMKVNLKNTPNKISVVFRWFKSELLSIPTLV